MIYDNNDLLRAVEEAYKRGLEDGMKFCEYGCGGYTPEGELWKRGKTPTEDECIAAFVAEVRAKINGK